MIHVEENALQTGTRGIDTAAPRRNVLYQSRRSEKGAYAHIWDLVSHLPRRKGDVDNLLEKFLVELNPAYDSLHEESFRANYEAFWNRRWADDDLTAIDLRWLSLLFMVLAFGELLDCPPRCSPEIQAEYEEASMQYFWASRKTLVIAPTFSGESPDLVRAGLLISRYLVYVGRKNESWLTSSFAVRMAQGQGMHIDGGSWGLPPKVLETRRRVWCALYAFDRSISLAIGRPYTVNDRHCMQMDVRNIWVDDKPDVEARNTEEHPLDDPTPSVFYIYQQKLAELLGHIHDDCFGLSPLNSSYDTSEKVLSLDAALLDWAKSLPAYFRFDSTDECMDHDRPYLSWQRIYLHSGYHFARITLHRPFVFLDSITDRFQYSRGVCIASACADLKLKLGSKSRTIGDRLRASAAMHNLFDSALVLGIIAVRDPSSQQTAAILQDLTAYCDKQNADPWSNEFVLGEVKVIELCIDSARKTRRDAGPEKRRPGLQNAGPAQTSRMRPHPGAMASFRDGYTGTSDGPGRMEIGANWLDGWFGPNWQFPEPLDYHLWEDLVDTLEAYQ